MKNISHIKIGALITYFTIGFNIVAGLIYTPWMIDQIGQSDYGLYTLTNSIISLFMVDFGLSSATSRFIAEYRAQNDLVAIQKFLSAIYKLYLLIDAVILTVLVVYYFSIDIIYQNFSIEEISKLKIIYGIAGLYSVISFPFVTFNGILIAYEKFIPLKIADLIQRMGAILFTVIALVSGYGLYAIVAVNAAFGLVSIIIKFLFIRKNISFNFVKSEKTYYKKIFNFSVWSTIWALSQRLIFNITPTIIGMVMTSPSKSIAIFGIISAIEGYVYTFTTAINGMFLSKTTRILMDDEDGKKITSLAIKVGSFQFLLNGLVIVGFILIGKQFIELWMGEAYVLAYYGILLVIIPGLFYNPLQIANTAMIAKNLLKYQAMIQVIMGCCNVCISLILTYKFGVIGAAVSICLAYIIRIVLTWILIYKKLNIDFKYFVEKVYIKLLVPTGLSLVISFFVIKMINDGTWLSLVIKGSIITIIFAVLMFFLGIEKDKRKNIINCIMSKFSKNNI